MKPRLTHHLMATLFCVVFTAEVHAQLVVTATADFGPGTLRAGIAKAAVVCASSLQLLLIGHEGCRAKKAISQQ